MIVNSLAACASESRAHCRPAGRSGRHLHRPPEPAAQQRDGSGFCGLAFWIALAGLTPTGLILGATVALVCVTGPGAGRPRWLCAVTALGISVVGALPWLAASLLGSSLSVGNGAGVDAFAPRAEPGLGTLCGLAGLAGSGTARLCLPRGQRFSRWLRPSSCWGWWRRNCRWRLGDRPPGRYWRCRWLPWR